MDIILGGFKKGELMLMRAVQQTGKSYWTNQAINRLMKDLMNRPVEQLVLAERLYSGTHFYTVEPVGGNWLDMEIWCLDTYGNPGSPWQETKNLKPETDQRWYMNDRKFWFRNERDRTLFILKWSV
jgi:hypothetical protein